MYPIHSLDPLLFSSNCAENTERLHEQDTRVQPFYRSLFQRDRVRFEDLRTYLRLDERPEYQLIYREVYLEEPSTPNKRVQGVFLRTFPLHFATFHSDQKLVTLLLDSGAYVDQVDEKGKVARDYAPTLNFLCSNHHSPRSVLENKNGNYTFEEVMRLRHSIGTYIPAPAVGNHTMALDAIVSTDATSKKIILERFPCSLSSLDLESLPAIEIDKLLYQLHYFISIFLDSVKHYKKHHQQEPSFIQCIKGNYTLILNWWLLDDLNIEFRMPPYFRTAIQVHAANILNLRSRLVRRVLEGKDGMSWLCLYPFLKDNENYLDTLKERLQSFTQSTYLRNYIRTNLLPLYFARNAIPNDYDQMAREILCYVFEKIPKGPTAIARLLTSRKDSPCPPGFLTTITKNLNRTQRYTLFLIGKRERYFRRLFDILPLLHKGKIKDKGIFDLAGDIEFESAFISWLKSKDCNFIQRFIDSNFLLFTTPNNEARAVFFSKILKLADPILLRERLEYFTLLESHFGRIMIEELSPIDSSIRSVLERAFFSQEDNPLKHTIFNLLQSWKEFNLEDHASNTNGHLLKELAVESQCTSLIALFK